MTFCRSFFSFVCLATLLRAQAVDPRLQEIVQAHLASHDFMGSVLIAKGEAVILSQGYGSANLEWNIPNSPATKFRLGSITKQFTAACVLLLEEKGKWKVTDAVKKYMPDAPPAWDKITLYNLLTHTSGIPSFTGFPEYRDSEAKATTPEKLVARFRDKPLEFEPGSKWNYSNSGYVLLGYLLEKVSNQTYQQLLQENIFTPLGMKDSGFDSNAIILPQRASGYSPAKNGVENAGFINMTIPFSAGSLYSTTQDLLKWERGLFGGKVLSAASLKEMTTPFKANYAFGLAVSDSNGRKKIEHGGGIEGFNTELAYWPGDQLTVVVLSNLNGNAPGEIANQLAAVVHGEKVILTSERKEITLSRDVLQAYVGAYEVAPKVEMVITLAGDHLESQLGTQPKVPIFAESPTSFFLKVVDAQLDFSKDASGKVTGVTLHQNGQSPFWKKK
jgi:CubicO group peptidase (beta-lactamase class C family)